MLYGYPDATGAIEQVCNDDTVDALPAGAIELTQEQAANRWDWRLVKGELIHSPRPSQDAEIAQALTNIDSLCYLAQTDWYIIRRQETGEAVPVEVLDKRKAARQAVGR